MMRKKRTRMAESQYFEGMREFDPTLCWRYLDGSTQVCILDRGHDGGMHESPKVDAPPVTIRVTFDVDINEVGVAAYYRMYPDLKAMDEDYRDLVVRETTAHLHWDGLVDDVREVIGAEEED
jgi:hypothetical protein